MPTRHDQTAPPSAPIMSAACCAPPPLKEARAKREHGEISADALKAVEDREIENVIKRQEDIGLKAVTDGEFRRAFWNYDFLGSLHGVEAYLGERKIKLPPRPAIRSRCCCASSASSARSRRTR